MKKKWLLGILSGLCASACVVGFSACSGGGNNSSHVHRYTKYVSNNDATCTEDGTETAICDNGCGETDTRTDVGSAGHDYTVYVEEKSPATCTTNRVDIYQCERCMETQALEIEGTSSHTYDQQVAEEKYQARAATCKVKAAYYYSCICGEKGAATFDGTEFGEHDIFHGACRVCEYQESKGLAYKLSSDSTYYIVTGIGDCMDADIVIPSIYNEKPVKEIGDNAFKNCDSLTEIVIPDSVTSIGDGAFYDCDSLTEIVVPDSVTSIGNTAFSDCDSLQYMIESDCKYLGNSNNPYVYLVGATSTDITSVAINDNCRVVGHRAFFQCDGLTSITIPDCVTSIGGVAFYGCNYLMEVVIPDSVKSIGSSAFECCNRLTMINYTGTIDSWAQISFGNPSANPFYYGKGLFYINNVLVTEARFATIKEISGYAFSGCSSLMSVVIPDCVTSIGRWAFAFCDGLQKVKIPDRVEIIGYSAFSDCSSLTSIVFEDTSTWYRTRISTDGGNKSGGTETSVTDSSTNATYFTDTYDEYYWYKL